MAKKEILKRGFKANAERLAKNFRIKLKIHPCAPLSALNLAELLEIQIYAATNFLSLSHEIKWLSNDCEWSALTMSRSDGKRIIIHNPYHSPARQQSDLMHELSHIICEHKRKEADRDFEIPFGMHYYDEEQEEEAKCLGSTLQLATPCLLWAMKRKMNYEEIAEYFSASFDMVKYRMNITGIAHRTKLLTGKEGS